MAVDSIRRFPGTSQLVHRPNADDIIIDSEDEHLKYIDGNGTIHSLGFGSSAGLSNGTLATTQSLTLVDLQTVTIPAAVWSRVGSGLIIHAIFRLRSNTGGPHSSDIRVYFGNTLLAGDTQAVTSNRLQPFNITLIKTGDNAQAAWEQTWEGNVITSGTTGDYVTATEDDSQDIIVKTAGFYDDVAVHASEHIDSVGLIVIPF